MVGERGLLGHSHFPYDKANVAQHVGDELAAVRRNRAELAAMAGLDLDRLVVMNPVHGRDVVVVESANDISMTDLGRVAPAADALVTASADVGLLVMGADCAPVTLADEARGIVAAVHVGWKGLAVNVIEAAVSAMSSLGAQARDVQAHIHPSICPRHYRVPADRVRLVPDAATVWIHGEPAIDLRAGLNAQLRALGVSAIAIDQRCTYESSDFFSYRRDAITGRHGIIIAT